MHKVRVLVANRPRLMRELVLATLSDQSDIEVAGEAASDDEISELVERTHPDFVIMSLQESQPSPDISGSLARHPYIRVVAIAPEKNLGVYFGTLSKPKSQRFSISEQALLDILRSSKLPDAD